MLTLGFWVLVWVALAVIGGEKRELLEVDVYGRLNVTRI